MPRILTVFGTRPEIIKLSPVIRACEERGLEVMNFFTGQQPDLGAPFLAEFDVAIVDRAEIMVPDQSVSALLARAIEAVDTMISRLEPDMVVVQGDTTSALGGALAANFSGVPVAHVEAGLRTGDLNEPYPEEWNRVLISRVSSLHFAPTQTNVEHLIQEGVDSEAIVLTGNPIVDVVQSQIATGNVSPAIAKILEASTGRHLIVATMHRRENFEDTLDRTLTHLNDLVVHRDDVVVLFLLHPNPRVREAAQRRLSRHPRLIQHPGFEYLEFLQLVKAADLLVSDSGGVQEEACTVGTPVLIVRNKTERPEAIEYGIARLVPAAADLRPLIESQLNEPADTSVTHRNPFGDGRSGERIAAVLADYFPQS